MRRLGEMIKETLDIDFGPTGDDELEPRNLCSGIGQAPQDTRATSGVAALVKCINDKNEGVIWMVRKVAKEVKKDRAIDQPLSEVWVIVEMLCYNGSKMGDDHSEFVDESGKDVHGFTQIRVVSPTEKGSSKVVPFMKSFADRMGQRCFSDSR